MRLGDGDIGTMLLSSVPKWVAISYFSGALLFGTPSGYSMARDMLRMGEPPAVVELEIQSLFAPGFAGDLAFAFTSPGRLLAYGEEYLFGRPRDRP